MGFFAEMSGQAASERSANERAENKKRAQLQDIAEMYGAYRPEVNQARMNALGNRMSAFQGTNNMMATMYGKSNAPGFSQLMQNPMGPTMMRQGNPYFPRAAPPKSMAELENIYGPGRVPLSAATQEQPVQNTAYGTNPSWSPYGKGPIGS
jgi:hypothetical protein